MNLLLIGVGNIGKRHLESALKLDSIKQIYVYDVDKTKLYEIARLSDNILVLDGLNHSPTILDFCIVATSSFNREEIIIDQLKRSKIRYLILEKVLFQKINSYDLIKNLVNDCNTKVYVNCPRRLMSDYTQLKNILKDEIVQKISVRGGNWNMASNAIHFLDLIAFFSSSKNILNYNLASKLDEMVIPSKREGYIEMFGVLTGDINGVEFTIECSNDEQKLTIEINSQNQHIIIDESSQKIKFNFDRKYKDFRLEYVSQLTYKALKDLDENGTCNLINYDDSSILHKLLIFELFKHQSKFIESNDNRCLIT